MLFKRILTALICIPVFICGLVKGGICWQVIMTATGITAIYELFKAAENCLQINEKKENNRKKYWSACGITCLWLATTPFIDPVFTGVIALFSQALLVLFWKSPENTLSMLGLSLFTMAYLGLPVIFLIKLRDLSGGAYMLILFFTAIWALDTGAYFSGRAFGKTGFHAFSPKKTLEGAIGGTAAVMVLLVLCHWLFLSRGLFFNKIVQWQLASFDNYMFSSYYGPVMLGLIIAAAGQAGDLLESALKRDLKIKDSGSILPGHGGIYDRFDSVFLSAPLCFYFFIFYK